MNTSTLELNAVRGELVRDILNIDDIDILKKIRQNISVLLSRVHGVGTKSKADILADLDGIFANLKDMKDGKIQGRSVENLFNEI